MKCPLCHHDDTRVMRTVGDENVIRRSRQCARCGHRWPTVEMDTARAGRLIELEREIRRMIANWPEER